MNRGEETKKEQKDSRNRTDEKDRKKRKGRENEKLTVFSNCLFLMRLSMRLNPAYFGVQIPLILLNVIRIYLPILFLRLILNGIMERRGKECFVFIAVMSGSMFLSGCLLRALEIRSRTQAELTHKKINRHLGQAVMRMPYSEVEQPKMRDFIEAAKDGNNVSAIFNETAGLLIGFLAMIGMGTIILTVQPVILLLIILGVAVKLWISQKNRQLWVKFRPEYSSTMRKLRYLSGIMTHIEYGKEIRLNWLSDWIYKKNVRMSDTYVRSIHDYNAEVMRNNGGSELTVILQEAIVYLILVYRVIFMGMPIGDFSMYLSSISSFSTSIRGMVEAVSSLMEYNLFASGLRECLEKAGESGGNAGRMVECSYRELYHGQNSENSMAVRTTKKDLDSRLKRPFTLEFCHVSFSYPQSDRLVLDDISLTLKEGESLSIVGVNGAGKTTFVRLLCRFYEPTKGKILLNGVDISTIPFAEYASLLGVVFQDYRLFAFSMEENITMGLPPSGHSVSECVEQSGLSSRLASLPKGLETNLSKEFDEEGVEFSGGEGQKLALARVLYKNASILVLDEPTAALDPLAEYEMYSRFHELVKGKCAVYISHRLSSTKFTDRIAVFSDGKLAEYGDHKKLMQISEGIYAQMFRMQAQYYI